MAEKTIKVVSYDVMVSGDSGGAERLLDCIAKTDISLLAYKSKAGDGAKTVFTLFALRNDEMMKVVRDHGYEVAGPYHGLFIEGDDVPGALKDIFLVLEKARIQVKESYGIANINGGYGVVLYLDENEKAYRLLGNR